MIDFDAYPFVVKVQFEDYPMYYNSGHYMLVSNPRDATRYKTEDSAQKDVAYASCQGGSGSVANFKTEYENYKSNLVN